MSRNGSNRKHSLRTWTIQVALLCLIGLHSLGLLHKHATVAEHDACLACQVVDHQPLGTADAASGSPAYLLALLFLVLLWRPGVVRGFQLFSRPQSRAPPFSLFS
jgi:hypothetical protein